MIYAILHDQKESEDVLQEAFVQMWKRTATYDPARSSLFTWAVMISRHKAIDRLRFRQRQTRLAEAVAEETGDSAASAPEERADNAFERNDERERVCAAMAKLGEGSARRLIWLFLPGSRRPRLLRSWARLWAQ